MIKHLSAAHKRQDLTSFAQKRVQLIARAEGNQDDPEAQGLLMF